MPVGLEVTEYTTLGLEIGIFHVAGTVTNTGDRTVERARVVVTLYDPWGTVLSAGFACTDRIPSGGKAAFDCRFVNYELVGAVAVQVEPG